MFAFLAVLVLFETFGRAHLSAGVQYLFTVSAALVLARYLADYLAQSAVKLRDEMLGLGSERTHVDPHGYPAEEFRDMALKINAITADTRLHITRLQEERDKISFILDNVNEGFLLLDEMQNVLLINNSACAYLDCDKSVIGRHILHCTRDYAFLQPAETAQKSGENQILDIKRDDRILETEFTIVGGTLSFGGGLIITMEDVTERRQAANMRRDFFANASHELKTPITSIKGSAELLASGVLLGEGQEKELLGRIELEAVRLTALIEDIIRINRLESGAVNGEREHIALSDFVKDCVDELQPLIAQNSLVVALDLQAVCVVANRKNLYEIVSNLVLNAVHYTPPSGKVDISLAVTDAEISFCIRNDGEPIPPLHQARVFERFYRIDRGRSKAIGGTGLGLSIVKHAVESLGGSIRLESREEIGILFVVTIPK